MAQKIITTANLVNGNYTILASDKGKHLIFYCAATILLPRYTAAGTGLRYTEDEVEITMMSSWQVSFVDNTATADIRVAYPDATKTEWQMNGIYSKAIIQKMDVDTYLVTGNFI